jgi:hypothetical protein
MKAAFILIISFITIASSFARDCRDDVSVYFYTMNEARDYDDQGVSNGFVVLESGEEFISNAVAVVNEFDFTVLAFEGYSDDNKGFGVEVLLVQPETCEIIDITRTF